MSSLNRYFLPLVVFVLPVFAGAESNIRNFVQVDAHVYRGGQPTAEGFQYLAKIGVKTVIDLRESDSRSQAEQRVVTKAGMQYINVPMTGMTPPTEAEIAKILAVLEDGNSGAVFVHCRRGADRTGAVIAAYHIDHDKWDNARALKDALGHGMGFFEFRRETYIKNFRARTLDATAAPATAAVNPVAAVSTAAAVN
jgi:tyrosine-protein phosphatase SIW14